MPKGATAILQRSLWSCWCRSAVLYDDQPADVGSASSGGGVEPGRLSAKALKQHLQSGRPAPGIVQVGCSLSQASHSTMSDDGGGSDEATMCLAAYGCGSSCGGGEEEQHDAAVRLIGLESLSPASGGACGCDDDAATAAAAAVESWDCSSPPSPDSLCGGGGDSLAQLDRRYFVPFDQLVFHELIGRGSFKGVYRGRWRNTNVAIVRMRRGGLLTEARLMQRLSTHPNLVQFYPWSQDGDGNEYCVMELVALGSLDRLLLQLGVVLRTSTKLSMCEQVCAGMAELAAEGVLHRDLAARNVLVQSVDPVHVKVADFGLAANTSQSGGGGSDLLGIPVRWAAPEVLLCQKWSQASDVWAFGVTAWEIFSNGSEPYANETDKQVVQGVLSGSCLSRPTRCPREMYRLMLDCWADDPAQRPSFKDILATFRKWQLEHCQLLEAAQQHSGQPPQQLGGPAFAVAAPITHARSWGPQQAAAAAAQVAAEVAARPGLGPALQARAGAAEHRVRFSMDFLLARAQQSAAAAGSCSEDSSGRGQGRSSSRASELPAGMPRNSGVAPSTPLQQLQPNSTWSHSYSAPLPLYSLNKHVGQLLQRGLVRPGPGCHWSLAGLRLSATSSCSPSTTSAGDADECEDSNLQQANAEGAWPHQADQAAAAASAARGPASSVSDARVGLWVAGVSGLHEQSSSSPASTPHARSRHAAPWAVPLPAAAWAQLQLQHSHQHAAAEQAVLCCSSGSPAALGLCGCQQECAGSSIDMSFDQEGEIDPNCVESLEGSCASEDWLPLPQPQRLGLGSCRAQAELPAPRTSCQFVRRDDACVALGTSAWRKAGPSINEIRPAAAPAPVAARHNPYTPVRAVVCGASAHE